MTDRSQRVVIVGGGLAGAKTAESLRGWGFEGRVTIVAEEPFRPYQRPPLSKAYLRGRSGFDDAAVHPEGFYADHDVDLLVGSTVTSIDVASRTVGVGPRTRIPWDHLVLATGARPRRLELPGADLDGIFYLRTLADADAIRAAAAPGLRVVVIGAGWVGTEVAASLRRTGSEVALVYRSAVPLEASFGHEIGAVLARLHASQGVELHPHCEPIAFRGPRNVQAVELADGRLLDADLVVVGAGAVPAAELAEAAGIATDDGVLTGADLRTSAPGVLAAGDVAAVAHPLFEGRVRSLHWWSALTQPPTVAANICGVPAVYNWVPTCTSKQYGLMIEHTGYAPVWDSIVYRGDPAGAPFLAFFLHNSVLVAGLSAGIAGPERYIRALVASRQPVAPEALADPDVDLAALVQSTRRYPCRMLPPTLRAKNRPR